MLGISHLVVYSMEREIHGEQEAKRLMARNYGFEEANAGSPHESPDNDEGWMSAFGRRLAAVVVAAVAVLQRL